jgi:two-component system NtrC family sensor kinase
MADSLKEEMRKMREAEQTLEKANQELKLAQEQMVRAETMAALGTLSSGISHELSTPLGVILNMAQLTKQDAASNPALLKDLEVIEEEAGQAIRITRSLLGFARTTKSQRESVSLNRVLEDLFKILEFQPAARSVKLARVMAPDLKPISANAGQMRQVFLNIILNAIQAMPGGGELRVDTRNCGDNGQEGVEIRITDTGVGIPEELGKKVFQPFFTTKNEGTGLGLAIVYGIVREHNGRIDVESEVGKGTTFTIFLPSGGGQDTA